MRHNPPLEKRVDYILTGLYRKQHIGRSDLRVKDVTGTQHCMVSGMHASNILYLEAHFVERELFYNSFTFEIHY